MAIEKEAILAILNGEGEFDEKSQTLKDLFDNDTKDQLSRVMIVKEQLKNEKTEEVGKRHAAEEKVKSLEAELVKANEALKANDPEGISKTWETKLEDAAKMHAAKEQSLNDQIENFKAQINQLEVSQKILECSEEFNKAIQGKNIAPDCLEDFKRYVLSENCGKFSKKPTGEGDTKVYATNDGFTIKQVTEQALLSTFGKNCTLNTSFGGSAEGAGKSTNPKDNPFISGNYTEQMRLYKEDRAKYEALKAAAGK